jgi:hypothetical protein
MDPELIRVCATLVFKILIVLEQMISVTDDLTMELLQLSMP